MAINCLPEVEQTITSFLEQIFAQKSWSNASLDNLHSLKNIATTPRSLDCNLLSGSVATSITNLLDWMSSSHEVFVPQAGTILSDTYRLECRLGQGGMGQVWLATHLLLNEPRAIKLILDQFANSYDVRQRFIQKEARLALNLCHPNIIRVYELGQHRKTPYIAMEYIENNQPNSDLRALLKAEGSLSPTRTNKILQQLAAAITVAHKQGLVHRDLKPANVLISRADEVKIIDFGLVKEIANEHTGTTINDGMGTYHYMSPEQAKGVTTISSDIYSLGVMLYEMLTGRLPFSGDAEALLYQHATSLPLSPHAILPDISIELSAVVMRALAKDATKRYSTAQELAEAFQDAL